MAMLEVNNLSIQFGGLQPYLIFLQVFISQQRELSSWMVRISPEKVLSILIKQESHEHSRIFDSLKI